MSCSGRGRRKRRSLAAELSVGRTERGNRDAGLVRTRSVARRRAILGGVLVVVLVACGPTVTTKKRPFSSGQEVDVISSGMVDASWDLDYCTHTTTHGALVCEVEALWPDIQSDAEAAGAAKAHVYGTRCSREVRFDGWRPVVLSNKSTGFVFEKSESGTWRRKGGAVCSK
jgi:hypothetical protein